MPTWLHCLLVGGKDYRWDKIVMCGRPGMASSVTKGTDGVMTRVGVEEMLQKCMGV